MPVHRLERSQRIARPRDVVFPLFSDARNLEQITPAWLGFRVLTPAPVEMGAGTLIDYRLRLRGLALRWRTEIVLWDPPRRFVDVQRSGPYRLWHHTHRFEADGDETLMRDIVRYALPLGPAGEFAHRLVVRSDLEAIFDFRRDEVDRLLAG